MTDDGTAAEWPHESGDEDRPRILYPVVGTESKPILRMADAIAGELGAEILVGHVVDPEDESPTQVTHDVSKTVFRSKMDPAMSAPIESHSIQGTTPQDAIVRAAERYDIDVILMAVQPDEDLDERVRGEADVDVLAVSNADGLRTITSILLPIGREGISSEVVGVVDVLAGANDARIDLVYVDEDESDEAIAAGETVLSACQDRFSDDRSTDAWVLSGESLTEGISHESTDHDLTVISTTDQGLLQRLLFGSADRQLRDSAAGPVLTMHRGSASPFLGRDD